MLLHVLLLIVLTKLAYIGHYGYDDMQYAELANDLIHGKFNFDDHFSYRLIPISLTALAYLIFGIGDFASSFFPVLSSLSILICVYQIQKNKGLVELSLSLSLCLLSPWFLVYSNLLMPDIFLALFFFLSLYCYYLYRYKHEGSLSLRYSFLMALSLFLAFNSKGTIILIIPLLTFLALLDFFSRKDYRFWFYLLGFLCLLFVLYFSLSYWITGEATKRFEAIYNNSYLNHCSYGVQSWKILIKRIGRDLFMLLYRERMLSALIFIIIAAINEHRKSFWRLKTSHSFWIMMAILALLSSNFMSISIGSYNPMCLDARHYLFLCPLLAIPGARGIVNLLQFHQYRLHYLVLALLFCGLYFYENCSSVVQVYLPLFILIGIFLLIGRSYRKWLPFLVVLVLLYQFIDLVKYAQSIKYSQQRDFLFEHVLEDEGEAYLVTDPVQVRLARYYQGFNPKVKKEFISFADYDTASLENKETWVLQNRHTLNLSYFSPSDLPLYARTKSASEQLIASDSALGLYLFKKPEIKLNSIFSSKLDYEKSEEKWSINSEDLVNNPVFSGDKAILCRMYSSTFVLELDNLQLASPINLFVSARVQAWTGDATEASLVISLEKGSQNLFYESKKIQQELRSYSAWWPIELNSVIEPKLIQAGAILKVYLYNPDQNSIYLDDFEVSLSEVQ